MWTPVSIIVTDKIYSIWLSHHFFPYKQDWSLFHGSGMHSSETRKHFSPDAQSWCSATQISADPMYENLLLTLFYSPVIGPRTNRMNSCNRHCGKIKPCRKMAGCKSTNNSGRHWEISLVTVGSSPCTHCEKDGLLFVEINHLYSKLTNEKWWINICNSDSIRSMALNDLVCFPV